MPENFENKRCWECVDMSLEPSWTRYTIVTFPWTIFIQLIDVKDTQKLLEVVGLHLQNAIKLYLHIQAWNMQEISILVLLSRAKCVFFDYTNWSCKLLKFARLKVSCVLMLFLEVAIGLFLKIQFLGQGSLYSKAWIFLQVKMVQWLPVKYLRQWQILPRRSLSRMDIQIWMWLINALMSSVLAQVCIPTLSKDKENLFHSVSSIKYIL